MPEDFTFRRLRIELLNDPVSLGYHNYFDAMDWTTLTSIVNAPLSTIAVSNTSVTRLSYAAAIHAGDFGVASFLALQQLQAVLTLPTLDLSTQNGFFFACTPFADDSQTRRNMSALALRPGSRSEDMFGANFFCCAGDISTAITAVSSLLSFL